jgi:hypothetical protein
MAARKRATTKKAGGRGSPEAIAKRRTARQLNALLEGGTKEGPKLDGRTEKRRKRLIQELKDGKRGEALKPVEAVSHANELLGLGESLASLKRQGVKPRKFETTPEVMEVVQATQAAYGYAEDAWKIIGITVDAAAPEKKAKRGRK